MAPIHTNSSSVSVTFPEGSSWVDWWNHSNMFTAKSSQTFNNVPLEDFPVFFRTGKFYKHALVQCSLASTSQKVRTLLLLYSTGSFLPLRVTEQTPMLGRSGFAGYLRWLLHSPVVTESPVSFAVREQEGRGIVASYR